MRVAILAALLCGCYNSTPRAVVNPYSGITAVFADQRVVDHTCRSLAHQRGQGQYLNDHGQPVSVNDVACCADKHNMVVYVAYGYEACIPHELCHLEHTDPGDCAKIDMSYHDGKEAHR